MNFFHVSNNFYVWQVKETALSIEPGLTVMACGSYRRGKATCGDVDVLITHPDGKSEQKVFSPLLTMLKKSGKVYGRNNSQRNKLRDLYIFDCDLLHVLTLRL